MVVVGTQLGSSSSSLISIHQNTRYETTSGVQGVAPDADVVSYRVFWWIDISDEDDEPS